MAGPQLLLELANWSTILVCAVLKLPQGVALLAAKSAQGLSLESLVLELSGLQNSMTRIVGFLGGWYVLGLQKWIVDLAMNLSTAVSAASKFAQLRCFWQTKDSGQVSALTWSLATYTCAGFWMFKLYFFNYSKNIHNVDDDKGFYRIPNYEKMTP